MVISSGFGQHFIRTEGDFCYHDLKKYLEQMNCTEISKREMQIALHAIRWWVETFPSIKGSDLFPPE